MSLIFTVQWVVSLEGISADITQLFGPYISKLTYITVAFFIFVQSMHTWQYTNVRLRTAHDNNTGLS